MEMNEQQRDQTHRWYAQTAIDGFRIIATNYLYEVPLYAYYVFEIEQFESREIKGTLMTCPITLHGPFERYAEACEIADQLAGEIEGPVSPV